MIQYQSYSPGTLRDYRPKRTCTYIREGVAFLAGSQDTNCGHGFGGKGGREKG